MTQWVYAFGGGTAEGNTTMKNLLGGKGANLAEMASLGLPVPPGFTMTTEVCTTYYDNGEVYPDGLDDDVAKGIEHIEKLTDETAEGLAKLSGDRRFALDSYRRFITMYSDVVMGVHHHTFEDILDEYKDNEGLLLDTDISPDGWASIIESYKAAVREALGRDFPQDPREQLQGAIDAVFGSWMNDRAVVYRRLNDIPAAWGTAVNVQAMVFGNMGQTSATGVAFTRDSNLVRRWAKRHFLWKRPCQRSTNSSRKCSRL